MNTPEGQPEEDDTKKTEGDKSAGGEGGASDGSQ